MSGSPKVAGKSHRHGCYGRKEGGSHGWKNVGVIGCVWKQGWILVFPQKIRKFMIYINLVDDEVVYFRWVLESYQLLPLWVYGYTSWDQLPRWFAKASSPPFSMGAELTQGFKYVRWRYLPEPYFRAVLGGGGFPGLWLSSKLGGLKIFESEIQVGFWVFFEGRDGVAELFLYSDGQTVRTPFGKSKQASWISGPIT